MTGEIVNLNRFRKARAKTTAKTNAAANRVAHGLTKTERDQAKAERDRLSRLLDQSKREE
jgi:hypothetical protein